MPEYPIFPNGFEEKLCNLKDIIPEKEVEHLEAKYLVLSACSHIRWSYKILL